MQLPYFYQLPERNQALYRSSSSKRRVKSAEERLNIGDAFKCGTPTPVEINKTSALRRHDYGEAVRKHSVRPKTAQEYLGKSDQKTYTHSVDSVDSEKWDPAWFSRLER